ncbi:hypothetical protein JCM10914A_43640 [Paenibacillus sp. JCM 10914]|uniref:hypothetical protein n=1 Tax=Paenibacillus sp. JCM 10914 TaxID=1236974 RepID=UPI0003CCA69A|nr:hypothetical protein [Paenibacillus sp. JCM 10914]GAE05588.1 hypothetical protein JCM10914_1696 [Paenibacillus sp. JCM 10914]
MIMTKRRWCIFGGIIGLFLLFSLFTAYTQSRTSFRALVLDHLPDNRPVEMIRIQHHYMQPDETHIMITNTAMIASIMDQFSDVKLKSTNDKGSFENMTSVIFKVQYGATFIVHLYEPNMMRVNNSHGVNKKYSKTYQITSGYDKTMIESLADPHVKEYLID